MNNNSLLFYAQQTTPRLQYIAYVLFDQLLGVDIQIITDRQHYLDSPLPKINYTNESLADSAIQIPNCGLLFEKNIKIPAIAAGQFNNLPTLFTCQVPTATFPFDFFSMAFFLMSRYEEYLPFTADKHGRFTADNAVATQYHFLHLPIVELWLAELRLILARKFAHLHFKKARFRFVPTYDIDLAWAYLHRPMWRTAGSMLKNVLIGKWSVFDQQQKVLRTKTHDPYDTFAFLNHLHQTSTCQPIFFFLLGDYGEYDKNIHPENKALQDLIKSLQKQYQIGIHPSYESNSSVEQLVTEVQRLQQIINQPIQHSRQHFLKLHLPTTYQNLIQLGITNDYSMGYAGQIGFRAGISQSYFWYDLRKEEMTNLLIHPFAVMDVTLQQYLQLSPEEAFEKVQPMIAQLSTVGGTFCTLWHNSSFSELHGWSGWQIVYQQIVQLAISQMNK